jgi:hypothetical protein
MVKSVLKQNDFLGILSIVIVATENYTIELLPSTEKLYSIN